MEGKLGAESSLVGLSVEAALIPSYYKLVGSSMEKKLGAESSLLNTFQGKELADINDGLLHMYCST